MKKHDKYYSLLDHGVDGAVHEEEEEGGLPQNIQDAFDKARLRMMKIVEHGELNRCEDIFDDLMIDVDIQNQVGVLESIMSGGFWSSIISLIATFAFLIDEQSKINSTKKITENGVTKEIHDKINEGKYGDRYVFGDNSVQYLWKELMMLLKEF